MAAKTKPRQTSVIHRKDGEPSVRSPNLPHQFQFSLYNY